MEYGTCEMAGCARVTRKYNSLKSLACYNSWLGALTRRSHETSKKAIAKYRFDGKELMPLRNDDMLISTTINSFRYGVNWN